MSTKFLGVAMDFGAGDLSITPISSAIGTFKLQDWDASNRAEVDSTKDANGQTVTRTYFDPSQEATFNYYVSGTGIANAIAQTLLPPIGTLCAVTSTNYTALASTSWIVESAQIKASNTKNKMITLKLRNYPAITAAAGN